MHKKKKSLKEFLLLASKQKLFPFMHFWQDVQNLSYRNIYMYIITGTNNCFACKCFNRIFFSMNLWYVYSFKTSTFLLETLAVKKNNKSG